MKTKTKIFIADDDPEDREAIEAAFNQLPEASTIYMFHSGKELFAYLEQLNPSDYPSLIVLDYHMPGQTGEEVLRKIKENSAMAQIPVIIQTTCKSLRTEKGVRESGGLMYLQKASGAKQLVEQARFYLELVM